MEPEHERYADRKKKTARPDVATMNKLFKGDEEKMKNIMLEYRLIQKEKREEAIDERATHPINEHKNRSVLICGHPHPSTRPHLCFFPSSPPWASLGDFKIKIVNYY